MKTMMIPAGLCFLLSGLGVARADVAVGVSASLVVEPTVPVPTFVPAAPPVHVPPAPVYAPAAVVETGPVVTGGQWVFTAQYGWLYMPYDSRYVVNYAAGPYAYVYYPSFGWRWLASPWVVGAGPYPHFGVHGPFAYRWYRGLEHAHHPWAAHYAEVHHRPYVAARPAAPMRAHSPAFAPHPAPPRPMIAPRPLAGRPANVAWQRGQGSFVRTGPGPRGRR